MKVSNISYSKVFSLGNYENEKLGVEIELNDGDDVQKAIQEARAFVEFNHKLNGLHKELDQHEYILSHPDDFTGNQVRTARERIDKINEAIQKGSQLLIQ